MKRKITTLIVCLLLSVLCTKAQELYIGSLYVTTPTEETQYGDGNDVWANRLPVICDMFNFEQADVLGLQALTADQLTALTQGMSPYLSTGNILYNNTLQLLESGNVSDLSAAGTCNWAKLKKEGTAFYVFNMFLNTTSSSEANTLVSQILQAVAQVNTGNLPCFIIGDMGLDATSQAYSTLAAQYSDCFTKARIVSAELGTKNDFDINACHGSERYDFIFAPQSSSVTSYGQLQYGYFTKEADESYKRRSPSTHYPVMAKVNLSDALATSSEGLYVASYNVRNKNTKDADAGNGWDVRRQYLINIVNFQRPDLLGVQEAFKAQVDDLLNGLDGYAYVGVGRDNGKTSGEYSAIFYRKARMVALDSGTFWLSDTPDKPSKGFPSNNGPANYYRICTWGKFYDKVANTIVYHFNTHIDLDARNQYPSYALIKSRILEIAGSMDAPVIISGDYNVDQTDATYNLFDEDPTLFDSYKVAKQKYMTNSTYGRGFNAELQDVFEENGELKRIDHLFITESLEAEHYGVLNSFYYSEAPTSTFTLRRYSDHNPVMVKYSYKHKVAPEDYTTTPPPSVNGVYQISTPDDLKALSKVVNGVGYYKDAFAQAVLTKDIDMTGVTDWEPIGTASAPFGGVFDGKNYTISNLEYEPTGIYNGLFGYINGATIKDFSINGSIRTLTSGERNYIGVIGCSAYMSHISGIRSALNVTVRCESQAGGILGGGGSDSGSDKLTIDNCSFSGTLIVNDGVTSDQFGGIVGYTAAATIKNCLFNGTLTSNASGRGLGGIIGYTREYISGIQNCLSIGKILGTGGLYGAIIGNFNTTTDKTSVVKNNYYISGSIAGCGKNPTKVETIAKTAAELASGEVCFLLNESTNGGTPWYQTIGTDDNPTLDSTRDRVFVNGIVCPDTGTPQGTISYSNSDGTMIGEHNNVDGLCTYCGHVDDSYMTPVNGYYEIGTPVQLKWFAAYVNASHPAVNAKLTEDIDMTGTDLSYFPIGNGLRYKGSFDGQGHKISNLKLVNTSASSYGMFNTGDGVELKNFWLDETCEIKGDATVGGIIGSLQGAATLEGIGSCATVEGTARTGGLIGNVNVSSKTMTMKNCWTIGAVKSTGSGDNRAGAICGWFNWGTVYIENCWTIAEVTGAKSNSKYIYNNGNDVKVHPTNCYSKKNVQSFSTITDDDVAGGALCYKLNGDQSNINWYQAIGTDAYPTLDSSKPNVYEIAVSDAGYASFVPEANILALPTGVTAYAGQKIGNFLHLEEVTELPADNAVIVKATAGNYYCNSTDEARSLGTDNDLTFSDTDLTATGNQYCLANGASGVGFYQVEVDSTIPARKVYLVVPASVRAFYGFDDEGTSINRPTPNPSRNGGEVYDLAGRKVQGARSKGQEDTMFNVQRSMFNGLKRGVYIVNGKKVLK